MKTKHFLTALAIPALLAACSAEDDFTLNNSQNLAGRKLINANLTFDFDGDADTRLAIGESAITLTEKDKVAAALIDRVKTGDSESGDVNGYMITTGIATNHPFSKSETGWNTPTQLVEGNYLFYYQYNAGLAGGRETAVPYNIGKVQNAFDKEAPTTFVGTQAVQDNAMGIGYAFLEAEEGVTPSAVKVNMYNLFAFLKFNIKTDKTGLEVQQILVKRGGNNAKFALSGKIANEKVAAAGSTTADGGTVSETNPKNAGVLIKKNDKKYTADFSVGTPTADEDYIILSLPDLAATATAQSAYMVIPAANYVNGQADAEDSPEFIVDVYTNQGVYSRDVELSSVGTDKKNYSELTMGTVQAISLDITGKLVAADKYFVGSAEQWGKVLESLPEATEDNGTLNIELLNDVELTKADIDLIQSTNAKGYEINITGSKMVLSESCALSDMTVASVSVKAGATVDLNKNLSIDALTNAGTVNINAVSGTGNTVAAVADLTNGSAAAKADNSAVVLNIKEDCTITTLTNNAGETTAKNATVNVEEGKTLTVKGTNKGTIENDGMIIANGVLTNSGSKAIINNNGTGILSNDASVSGSAVENADGANINAAAGSETIVKGNAGSTITYKDGATVSVNGTDKGKIAYVVTAEYLVPTENVEYNTIVVDGLSLVLKNSANQATPATEAMLSTVGITNVVLKSGATVDFKLLKADEAVTLIEIQGKNNRIITTTTGVSATTLKVAEGGYVLIPINSKVALTGETTGKGLQNEGTINVGGSLTYKATEAVKGTLLGTGTITEENS